MEDRQTKYGDLIHYLENLIAEGKLNAGDRLPSENELTERFGISRQTVRKAIGLLEE